MTDQQSIWLVRSGEYSDDMKTHFACTTQEQAEQIVNDANTQLGEYKYYIQDRLIVPASPSPKIVVEYETEDRIRASGGVGDPNSYANHMWDFEVGEEEMRFVRVRWTYYGTNQGGWLTVKGFNKNAVQQTYLEHLAVIDVTAGPWEKKIPLTP